MNPGAVGSNPAADTNSMLIGAHARQTEAVRVDNPLPKGGLLPLWSSNCEKPLVADTLAHACVLMEQ